MLCVVRVWLGGGIHVWDGSLVCGSVVDHDDDGGGGRGRSGRHYWVYRDPIPQRTVSSSTSKHPSWSSIR